MRNTDNLKDCANCGHVEYHHRPECTYRPYGANSTPPFCECQEFKDPS